MYDEAIEEHLEIIFNIFNMNIKNTLFYRLIKLYKFGSKFTYNFIFNKIFIIKVLF